MKQVPSNLKLKWLFPLACLFLFSCKKEFIRGNGNLVTEHRAAADFTDVEIFGPFEVKLVPDSISDIEISAEENVMNAIETGTRDNSVFIRVRSDVRLRNHLPMSITVHNPAFQRVKFNGSGSLTNKDTLKSAFFKYELNGSAGADLKLNVENLDITINGSGSTTLSGYAEDINGTINGSGDVDAGDLPVNKADLTINGSGTYRVWVNEQLNAKIYGSGNIYFKGDAALSTDIKGSGKIIR